MTLNKVFWYFPLIYASRDHGVAGASDYCLLPRPQASIWEGRYSPARIPGMSPRLLRHTIPCLTRAIRPSRSLMQGFRREIFADFLWKRRSQRTERALDLDFAESAFSRNATLLGVFYTLFFLFFYDFLFFRCLLSCDRAKRLRRFK